MNSGFGARLNIRHLAVFDGDPIVLLAAVRGFLFRRTDPGGPWSGVASAHVLGISRPDQKSQKLIALTPTSFLESPDLGATWQEYPLNGIPDRIDESKIVIRLAKDGRPQSITYFVSTPHGTLYETKSLSRNWRMTTASRFEKEWRHCRPCRTISLGRKTTTEGCGSANVVISSSNREQLEYVRNGFSIDLHPKTVSHAFTKVPNTENAYRAHGTNVEKRTSTGWVEAQKGLGGRTVYSLAARDQDAVYAGTDDGVFVTKDGGWSWNRSGGLRKQVTALLAPAKQPDALLAGTEEGVLISSDSGLSFSTWQASSENQSPATDATVTGFLVDPNEPARILASTTKGVFESTDGGTSWRPRLGGLTTSAARVVHGLTPLSFSEGTLLAATDGGVFRTEDGGANWRAVNRGIHDVYVDNPIPIAACHRDFHDSHAILCRGFGDERFRSWDGGETWVLINRGIGEDSIVRDFFISSANGQRILAVSGDYYRSPSLNTLWTSSNGGRDWFRASTRGPAAVARAHAKTKNEVSHLVFAYGSTDDRLFALVTFSQGESAVAVSRDFGKRWRVEDSWVRAWRGRVPSASGWFTFPSGQPEVRYTLKGRKQYGSGDWDIIEKSMDGGQTWREMMSGVEKGDVRAISVNPTNKNKIVAYVECHSITGITNRRVEGCPGTGLYYSDDGAWSWKLMKRSDVLGFGDARFAWGSKNTLWFWTGNHEIQGSVHASRPGYSKFGTVFKARRVGRNISNPYEVILSIDVMGEKSLAILTNKRIVVSQGGAEHTTEFTGGETIRFHSSDLGKIYLGSNSGFHVSSDGGASWINGVRMPFVVSDIGPGGIE